MFPETGFPQPSRRASRELRWGCDGASLGFASGYSVDPIAADINFYRYCGNTPLIAVDPLGEELKWTQSLIGKPQLNGGSGFSMQVRQVLSGGIAAPGAQTWQTNDVKFIALISKDNKCDWVDKHYQRLNVQVPQGDQPYRFPDTVAAEYDPNGADVCFLFITITRNHGLRPFAVTGGKVTFPTSPWKFRGHTT